MGDDNSVDPVTRHGREFQIGTPVRLVHMGYAYLSEALVLATGPVDHDDGMVGVTWEAVMRGRGDEMLHGVRVPPDWLEVLGSPLPILPGWLLRSRYIREQLADRHRPDGPIIGTIGPICPVVESDEAD